MGQISGKPGPDPGTHHAGTFKPGKDKRRHMGGRSRYKQGIESLCRIHTEKNITVLLGIIEDDDKPTSERIRAIELMLAHGHGKPVDRVAIAQLGSDAQAPSEMTTAQLMQAVMEQLPPQEGLKQEGSVGYLDSPEILNNSEVLEHSEMDDNSESIITSGDDGS